MYGEMILLGCTCCFRHPFYLKNLEGLLRGAMKDFLRR
jgi:hypothetical protein